MSGIRDRGKIKWQSAFFMPEHVKMLRDLKSDYHKTSKPILDEYQIEELEQNLCRALELNLSIKLTIWENGFFSDYHGSVHKLDVLEKKIYLEHEDGSLYKMNFSKVVDVVVEEK